MLRASDFQEGVWKRHTQALQARLAELREHNDRLSNTNEQTLAIRGRIDEVKRILALPKSSASPSAGPGESWPPRDGE